MLKSLAEAAWNYQQKRIKLSNNVIIELQGHDDLELHR
jgi:hypothetical protein